MHDILKLIPFEKKIDISKKTIKKHQIKKSTHLLQNIKMKFMQRAKINN